MAQTTGPLYRPWPQADPADPPVDSPGAIYVNVAPVGWVRKLAASYEVEKRGRVGSAVNVVSVELPWLIWAITLANGIVSTKIE